MEWQKRVTEVEECVFSTYTGPQGSMRETLMLRAVGTIYWVAPVKKPCVYVMPNGLGRWVAAFGTSHPAHKDGFYGPWDTAEEAKEVMGNVYAFKEGGEDEDVVESGVVQNQVA